MIGKAVVDARDTTISNFDSFFDKRHPGRYAQFISDIYVRIPEEAAEAVRELLPCIVDETLAILLQKIDRLYNDDEIDIIIKHGSDSVSLFEAVDILSPEYLPNDGWVGRFSKERVVWNPEDQDLMNKI